ncbi:hypothetical protein [Pseudonocardia sp. ICBG1293]|uniref:hypothetical protein n=1 Tax=Pseudonocardia sp. ICBG1293 TaxID=2844382 RepID=UPI001CD03938|nr:hypothetical protein [Pseudonocardia sp. ICBG1293]
MSERGRRRELLRAAQRSAAAMESCFVGARAAAETARELRDRRGIARLVWTAMTMHRCAVTQTYWKTRHGHQHFHVVLALPEATTVIVEMHFPDTHDSVLVVASHAASSLSIADTLTIGVFPAYAHDLPTVRAWLLPDLAD